MKLAGNCLSDFFDSAEDGFFPVLIKAFYKLVWFQLFQLVIGEEANVLFKPVCVVLHLKEAKARVVDSEEEIFVQDSRHFPHIVSSHLVLPDSEIFGELVLLEEADLLQGVVPFLIGDPRFP